MKCEVFENRMLKLIIYYGSRYFDESSVLNTGGKSSLNSTLRRVSTYLYGLDMALLVIIFVLPLEGAQHAPGLLSYKLPAGCSQEAPCWGSAGTSQLCGLHPDSSVSGRPGCNSAGAFLHVLSFWFPLTLKYQGSCQIAPSSRLHCLYQMKNSSSNTKELLCCIQEAALLRPSFFSLCWFRAYPNI